MKFPFIFFLALLPHSLAPSLTPFFFFYSHSPQTLVSGMNKFLKQLNVTFRRDPSNYRPRINKLESVLDKEQKESGNYFFADD